MPMIYIKNEYLYSVGELFGFIIVYGVVDGYFTISLNHIGKRELIRKGIPYLEQDSRILSDNKSEVKP